MTKSALCLVGTLALGVAAYGTLTAPTALAQGPILDALNDLDADLEAHAAGPTKIDTCQAINQSGSYALVQDIQAEPASNCIDITASHVSLDLMGFSIIGNGTGHGVNIDGPGPLTNVEVRAGTVRGFDGRGIYAPHGASHGHRVIGVRVESNAANGIELQGSSHLVTGCTAVNNGTIQTVSGNDGIHVDEGSTVTGNVANFNARHGIEVFSGSTVTGNTARGNQRGIVLDGRGITATGNSVENNSVGIDGGSNSTITGNTAHNNGTGIGVSSSNLVKGNTVTAGPDGREGITISGDFNAIEENLLTGYTFNALDGAIVLLALSADNYCDNNRFADNSNSLKDNSGGASPACTSNIEF